MLDVSIFDKKNSNRAKVNDEGSLSVIVDPHPPQDESVVAAPFVSDFLSSDGSNDLLVNGSITSVDFNINADPDLDTYIKTISVIISDPAARLDRYGGAVALTNGTQLIWETQDLGTINVASSIKTNLGFVRSTGVNPAFGSGADAFKADLSGAGADAFLPVFDLANIFGLVYGVRLRAGTNDKLIFRIRDDLTASITEHNAIGYGIII